jgi:hypothetical protein
VDDGKNDWNLEASPMALAHLHPQSPRLTKETVDDERAAVCHRDQSSELAEAVASDCPRFSFPSSSVKQAVDLTEMYMAELLLGALGDEVELCHLMELYFDEQVEEAG